MTPLAVKRMCYIYIFLRTMESAHIFWSLTCGITCRHPMQGSRGCIIQTSTCQSRKTNDAMYRRSWRYSVHPISLNLFSKGSYKAVTERLVDDNAPGCANGILNLIT